MARRRLHLLVQDFLPLFVGDEPAALRGQAGVSADWTAEHVREEQQQLNGVYEEKHTQVLECV